jgi:hypothetical protein
MASSGTYNFNPSGADATLTAFSRCGKSSAMLTAEHMRTASDEANYCNVEWINRGVNLWESKLIQLPSAGVQLTQGVGTIPLPQTTVAILFAYRETVSGSPAATSDITLGPLSTTEYGAINNKLTQAPPTSYWFDKQIIPNFVMWPVPDQSNTYSMFVRVLQQIQDVVLPAGVTLDVPYRFFDAFVAALAERLSVHYAPERYTLLNQRSLQAWELATTRGAEDVMVSIAPNLGSYFRL